MNRSSIALLNTKALYFPDKIPFIIIFLKNIHSYKYMLHVETRVTCILCKKPFSHAITSISLVQRVEVLLFIQNKEIDHYALVVFYYDKYKLFPKECKGIGIIGVNFEMLDAFEFLPHILSV